MKVCFMGGSQAGILGALTLLSKGLGISAAVSYFAPLSDILKSLKVPVYSSVQNPVFLRILRECDILFSVHGREILVSRELGLPRLGCFNVHPYLYKYKGKDPVGRALKDGNFKGSVGVHRMEEGIDAGEVITEEFVEIKNAKTPDEIYNRLYPYYASALIKAIEIITK